MEQNDDKQKKVLIIEDQVDIAKTLQSKIQTSGLNVLVTHDGEEGLKSALENRPNLILLDLILPKMDGMTLLKKLREDEWGKDVPVIILSNLGTGDEIERAKNYNVSEFLIKTEWRLDDVVSKIQQLL